MWTHKNTFTIGGLENVGYAPGEDNLLVLSAQGQGIFDCIRGEKNARLANDADWWQHFNQHTNSIVGFDILDKKEIQTGGLHGKDHLVKTTRDGWTLTISTPIPDDKPFDNYLIRKIYLVSPGEQQKILVSKDGHLAFPIPEDLLLWH